MNINLKRVVSGVLSTVMMSSMINVMAAATMGEFEENFGLTTTGGYTNKNNLIPNAVEYASADNIFTYDGRSFILVDSEEKNGQTTFFVVANEAYGKYKYSLEDVQANAKAYWNPDDTKCVAYWLNHDFLTNGNDGKKIPTDMQSYIDAEHVWHTEPLTKGETKDVVTEDKYYAEQQTKHPISLLAQWEFVKYSNIIGQLDIEAEGDTTNWFLRTARNDTNMLGTGRGAYNNIGLGSTTTFNQQRLIGTRYIRPCFYLKSDFFDNYKIESIGKNVAAKISPYCNEELYKNDPMFAAPSVEDVKISGEAEIGKTLTVTYKYKGEIAEGASEIAWYECDTENGTYKKIRRETDKSLVITDDLGGKYIKASVTPKSVSAVNTTGSEVMSNSLYIFGDGVIADAIAEVKKATADTLYDVLNKNNKIFNIDLSLYSSLSAYEKTVMVTVFAKESFETVAELQGAYVKAIDFAKLVCSSDETVIATLIKSENIGLDLIYYNLLSDEQKATIATYIKENSFNSIETFQKTVNQQCAVMIVNAQTAKSGLISTLKQIDDLLTADLASLGNYQMSLVGKAVLGTVFESFADLDSTVKAEAVKARNASVTKLGLVKAGRQATALEGAVGETPSQYLFKVDGQKFIMLDSEVKNGKTYYFILSEDVYGTHKYRTDGLSANWDPDDEGHIAYWLNNDFLENGNGGKALPESIKTYLDIEHIWNTEPVDGLSGFDEEQITSHPLAFLSKYEWQKYIGKIGQNVSGYWWFRTARSGDVSGEQKTQIVLITGSSTTVGTQQQSAVAPNTVPSVRPCFWISEDFFKNVALESAGSDVATKIDTVVDKSLYSDADKLENCFAAPVVENVAISGEIVAGQVLTSSYKYNSAFEEDNTSFAWYQSSSEDGAYTQISGETGKTLTLTEAMAGKYIKVGVTPKSKSVMNPIGREVLSSAVGKVYGSSSANASVSAVNSATAENVLGLIEADNQLYNLDLDLSEFDSDGKANIGTILVNANMSTVQDVRDSYNKAIVIESINETRDKSLVADLLTEEALLLDLTRYNALSTTDTVINNIYKKDFNSISAFDKAFYETVAVVDFAEADRSTVIDALKGNKFTTDLSVYTDEQLQTVATTILAGTYATYDELDSAITAAVSGIKPTATATPAPTKAPSSGGGGGGGGASSASTAIANRQDTPKIETEDKPAQTAAPTEEPKEFNDIDEVEWAKDSIIALKELDIVSGDENGNFRPNDNITREEFTKLVVEAFLRSDVQAEENPFKDVMETAWYANYISIAYEKGIIGGVADDTFGVGENITRQDMAAILYRTIMYIEEVKNSETEETVDAESVVFADFEEISDYAKEAVEYMASRGIINGVGDDMFAPTQNATRAMAARILNNVLNAK